MTTMAVNILTTTPIARVSENPLTMLAPNVVPNQKRMAQVISVERFESRMDGQAFFQPRSIEFLRVLPERSSSFNPFKDQDVGIHGHAHAQDETSNTR